MILQKPTWYLRFIFSFLISKLTRLDFRNYSCGICTWIPFGRQTNFFLLNKIPLTSRDLCTIFNSLALESKFLVWMSIGLSKLLNWDLNFLKPETFFTPYKAMLRLGSFALVIALSKGAIFLGGILDFSHYIKAYNFVSQK